MDIVRWSEVAEKWGLEVLAKVSATVGNLWVLEYIITFQGVA
jgi:hypothetical protein